jgi:hypothetical protein
MKRFVPEVLGGGKGVRWTVSAVIAAVLVFGAGGVAVAHFRSGSTPLATMTLKASTCADAYRRLLLRPSQVTAASSACLAQSLKFTGELTGSVSQAYTASADDAGPSGGCTTPKRWGDYPVAQLAMAIGAKAYRLRISPPGSSEHQGVAFKNLTSVIDLSAFSDPSTDWSQATGTLTVNPDGVTGTIDASLLRDVAGAQPVHITGQWACGTPALTTFDSSVPCASFYALNHLQDADVARMKAQACNPQDLIFSGDISAHLDHAITDTAISAQGGIYGDNQCGAGGNEYDAALKFSLGDESFLLDLTPRSPSDSPIGPGQYPAGAGPFSANANLWLGQADPSHNGLFVIDGGLDPGVHWYGTDGSFTIAPDMKSGTIDETFSGAIVHTDSTVQITGSWRCAA